MKPRIGVVTRDAGHTWEMKALHRAARALGAELVRVDPKEPASTWSRDASWTRTAPPFLSISPSAASTPAVSTTAYACWSASPGGCP